jgi:hypothetical protein
MSKFCECIYCENSGKVITNPVCPKFEQDQDDEDYVICRHVLIRDTQGFCEINYQGKENA